MNTQELLRLSLTSILSNKLRSGLTTLGIIIGVFAVILLISIGTGLQAYITNQITNLGSNLIFVIPGSSTAARGPGGVVTNKLAFSYATEIEQQLSDIAEVGPAVNKAGNLTFGNKTDKGASILGTSANYPKILKITVTQGIFFSKGQERSGAKVALVGTTVVKDLFPDINPIGQKIVVDKQRYTVVGVLASRGSIFGIDEDNVVVAPVTAIKAQYGVSTVNTIYLTALKASYVDLVKERTKTILLRHLTENDFTVQSQDQALSTINNITNILTLALGGIAGISLLVGGIGVMNIMLVSVTERTKEIGLRKALGAQRSDILKQFLLEAVMLSLLGGTVGIALGIGVSLILAKFFISVVTPWSIFLAFGFSAAVGIIFGSAPAFRASKLNPIEALRFE